MASSMRRALSALKIVSGVFNFMVDVPQVPRPIFPLSLVGDWLSSVCYWPQCPGAVIRVIHRLGARITREQVFTMVAYTVDRRGLG
jgi:hypothetical protein